MLDNTYINNHTLYFICFYFFIFSFLGWLMESVLCSITGKEAVNRGFLAGPLCPIYGFGMSLVIVILSPFQNNLLVLFIGGFVLATTLEYFVGYLLEKLFNAKWWDYSAYRFNLRGRICPQISLCWGLLSVVMVKLIVPYIDSLIGAINLFWGHILIYICILVTALDTAVTVYHIIKLNDMLGSLTRIKQEIKAQYEKSELYFKTEEFKSNYGNMSYGKGDFNLLNSEGEKWKARFEQLAEDIKCDPKIKELNDNISELRKKYSETLGRYNWGQARLLKAFPNLKAKKDHSSMNELKEKIMSKIKRD